MRKALASVATIAAAILAADVVKALASLLWLEMHW